ncbi:hypothetical protein LPJ61_004168, partial [Coemansia biformis]
TPEHPPASAPNHEEVPKYAPAPEQPPVPIHGYAPKSEPAPAPYAALVHPPSEPAPAPYAAPAHPPSEPYHGEVHVDHADYANAIVAQVYDDIAHAGIVQNQY